MPANKKKPVKRKPVAPDQYPAAFMKAIRKSLVTPKPKGERPDVGRKGK